MMITVPLLLMMISSAPTPISDNEILYEAKYNCRNAKPEKVNGPLLK